MNRLKSVSQIVPLNANAFRDKTLLRYSPSRHLSYSGIPPPHHRVNVWDVIVWAGPLIVGGYFLSEACKERLNRRRESAEDANASKGAICETDSGCPFEIKKRENND